MHFNSSELALLKKYILLVVIAMGVSTTAQAAAKAESYYIRLRASIPHDSFHVRPDTNDWLNQVQYMHWDAVSEKLTDVVKSFRYKNTTGAIQGYITNTNAAGYVQLTEGSVVIPLSVTFNGIEMSHSPVDVVGEKQASTGGNANLVISAGDKRWDSATYAGEYIGTIALLFEPKN